MAKGSNLSKTNQKRERNAAKLASSTSAHSQLEVNKAAMSIKCAVCMTTFLKVTSPKSLKDHSDSKHAKKTFKECFPDQEEP